MASTWSTGGLNLRLMTTGENDNTWGDQTNDNLKRLENKITGYAAVTLSGTTHTLTFTDNPTSYADEDGRNFVLNFGGSPGGTCTVTIPARETVYLVLNNTADSNTITLTTGSGTTFNVPAGKDAFVYSDGTNVYNAMADAIFTTITGDGSALTGVLHDVVDDTTPQLGGNLDLNSNNITGTGSINVTGSGTFSGDLTVDTNTLYVDSTNNRVGISTTSPSALLHIKQDAGTTPTLSTGTRFVVQRNTFGGDPNGMAIIAGNNTTDGAFIDFGISTDADIGKIKYDTQNNIFQFYANTIERFRIEPAEVVVNDPSNDVDFRVESNTNTHALFVDGGDSSVYIGKSDSSFGTAGVRLNVAGLNYNQFTRDGGSAVNINRLTSDGDLMAFYKDSTKVGSIGTYAGDIIIGTTDTGLRFDDGASAYIPWNTSTNSATDGTISLGATTVQYNNLYLSGTVTNDGSGGMSIDTSGNVTFNEGSIDADFRVESNTETHALFVDGGNNVIGVGTSAPDSPIHVKRNTTSGSQLLYPSIHLENEATGTSYAYLQIETNNGATDGGILAYVDHHEVRTNQYLTFRTGALFTERMRIDSSGNVGIGTTSPSSPLDVVGDLKFGTSASRNYLGDFGTVSSYLINYNATGNLLFYVGGGTGDKERVKISTGEFCINEQSNDYDFRVESNNFANMLFVNGGTDRVGIGTNSPTTTLDVSKDSTSNIRVGGTGGGSVDTRFYIDNVGNGGSGRGVAMQFRPSGSSNSVEAVKLIAYQETASTTANNAKFAIQVANSGGTLTERVSIDNVGTFNITGSLTVNGSAVGGGETASVWVNFNGTGTVAIRDDYNVSSITDNGTGDYSVNFTSSLANTNYSFTTASGKNSANQFPVTVETSSATSNIRVLNANFGGSLVDNDLVCIHIFGG